MAIKPNRRLRGERKRNGSFKVVSLGRRRLREIIGIFLLAFTALTILSLVSYHAGDPSPLAGSTRNEAARNYAGKVGAWLAGVLIQFLGSAAVLTPLLWFCLSLTFFIPRSDHPWRRRLRLLGLALIIIDAAAFPKAVGFGDSDPFYGRDTPPGGVFGAAIGQFIVDSFGRPGGVVVLTAVFFLGLILATGMSLATLLDYLKRAWRWIRRTFGGWLRGLAQGGSEEMIPPRSVFKKEEKKPPQIVEKLPEIKISPPAVAPRQTQFQFKTEGRFELPPLSLLNPPPPSAKKVSRETLMMNSKILEKKLKDFGIEGQVTHVHPGPVITMYEYAPAPGIKVNRIANLADDLAMAMSAYSVRVVAPIPGKSVVGIEIPNAESETVYLMEILSSDEFKKNKSKLAFALGKDIFGHPVSTDLSRMPHLLIAGATGTGKSVMLNTLIASILFRATPQEVKFLFIDPKMVELTPYEGIPHLIVPPVTNPKKASWALKRVVEIMEGRYKILAEKDAKSIESYNQMARESAKKGGSEEAMPYLVIVIDELADLMMLASNDVEDSVTRLAQMARAVGIHLVLATQRPSVNVITGVIKANLPTRLSFQVSSKNDSRIILDANGAEQLLGKGDMLYLPPGASKLRRIHGAFITEVEIKRIVDFIRAQGAPEYDEDILRPIEEGEEGDDAALSGGEDEKYSEAVELVRRSGQASISMIQRRLRVGYNRAARMVEQMEKDNIISPPDGIKPRRLLGRTDN